MNRDHKHVPTLGFSAKSVLLLALFLFSMASSCTAVSNPPLSPGATVSSSGILPDAHVASLSKSGSCTGQKAFEGSQPAQPPGVPANRAALLLIYGDYVNEAGQEPTAIWEAAFNELEFTTLSCHIANLPEVINADIIVVLPSVGTSDSLFGVTAAQAQVVLKAGLPVLLLGYAHEVLDQIWNFDPVEDFIPCVESYLWTSDPSLQIFTAPWSIPSAGGQLDIYDGHVTSDAYRLTVLPRQVSVLGTNFEGSGAQLLWFRAFSNNTALYYWSVDQVSHLSGEGLHFLENLVHWMLRSPLAERLASTLAAWQLALPSDGGYWAVQGAGGFGYSLEPSIAFTYYATDIIQTHGLGVNVSSFGDWLVDACYNAAEGCFEDIASPQLNDRCITTGMATLTLASLNRLTELDENHVGDYLASCQDPATGGFFSQRGSSQTSLKASRFAIQALAVLDQLFRINVTQAKTYIASFQELNPQSPEHGGFYASSGSSPASLVASLDAVQTLGFLESLSTINQTALLCFIASCEDPPQSGIFDTKVAYGTDEWVMGTGCALRILQLLDALPLFDSQASRSFLLTNQFPNGGWGRGDASHDFHNTPDETWYAVQGLTATGDLSSSQDGLEEYLAGCRTGWGGATEPQCFGDLLTSWRIVSALHGICELSAINQSAFASYLANCWVIARSSIGAHQLPSSVRMDTDTATPDRCIIETSTFGPLYHYAYSQLVEMLGLDGSLWATLSAQIRTEIKTSQTLAAAYRGMFGLHHLYVGRENDWAFRFDTTCWSLLAYEGLGGSPSELLNATATLEYLRSCLQDDGTHEFFSDMQHQAQLPLEWRAAGGHLADTWLGLQAWAYLDPSMNGLNGHRLALHAATYLEGGSSLVTAFYAASILQLLARLGLDPDADNLIDRDTLVALLWSSIAYTGLAQDQTQQSGRWTPYVTALSVQLATSLDLLPRLDVNPALRLSLLAHPAGNCSCGDTTTITATVNETQWGIVPPNISLSATILNATFTNFTGPDPLHRWNCTFAFPYWARALGPQDLKVTAEARHCLPAWEEIAQVCTIWGTLSTTIAYAPGLIVPRSVPLDVTLVLKLNGASGTDADIADANVLLTNTNASSSYSAVYLGAGTYAVRMLTNELNPGRYRLQLDSVAPYVAKQTVTEFLTIMVFATRFAWASTIPSSPIAREPLTLQICLQDENNSRIIDSNITFCITKPGQGQPWLLLTNTTNASGIAACRWTPLAAGQWNVSYSFEGMDQYDGCSGETGVLVSRRPSRCNAEWTSAAVTFVGNHCLLTVSVLDGLNGSGLADRTVSFYEGAALLYTTFTDSLGHAAYTWIANPPLGTHSFHMEVAETPLHDGWVSSELSLTVRSTTTVVIANCTQQLYSGETGRIEVSVAAQTPDAPNGTASVYWDGVWQLDFAIFNGEGNTLFSVPFSEIPGQHLLAVLFGHLDSPDVLAPSSASLVLRVLQVFVPTLAVTVKPGTTMDFLPDTSFSVDAFLTYRNATTVCGLSANITLQLATSEGKVLLRLAAQTNAAGEALWILSTPQPGSYNLTIQFDGVRGFEPAVGMTTLTIQPPLQSIIDQSLPLTLVSLAVMASGLVFGTVAFLRLRKRADAVVRLLRGTQSDHSASPAWESDSFSLEPQTDQRRGNAAEGLPDDE